ncbi:MAG: hypothetical protein KBT39_13165 [Bacteroidales bacterium]|nr:hypothetical protein [Bacteroidales bacterium]
MNRREHILVPEGLNNPLALPHTGCFTLGMACEQHSADYIEFIHPAFCYNNAMLRIMNLYSQRLDSRLPFTIERIINKVFGMQSTLYEQSALAKFMEKKTGHSFYESLPSPFLKTSSIIYGLILKSLAELTMGRHLSSNDEKALIRGIGIAVNIFVDQE